LYTAIRGGEVANFYKERFRQMAFHSKSLKEMPFTLFKKAASI
jgi:hypothetical protein